ncbi:hypothetical protein OS189_07850 [Sulfitobacter sp. F26169L]|uniref:hypothetical protein n=1 Tax=Sulfitobacter sp. F26169L TaxID=2996015 RepID=UPI002260C730|nr:hypothetical protein [Sulfitobacter sp. F26169L]MCX7566253.1 hypothetical protein [Sulfitobacter sp. F26169L]
MAMKENSTKCGMICWSIAALTGALSFAFLFWSANAVFSLSLLLGALIGVGLGIILNNAFCNGRSRAIGFASAIPEGAAAGIAASDTITTPDNKAVDTAAGTRSPKRAAAGTKAGTNTTSSAAFSQTANAVQQGSGIADGPSESVKEAQNAAKPAVIAQKQPNAGRATASAATTKPAAKTSGQKPETMLAAPRPEGKDDLKLISGVGPKLEQTLNDLGVYHFDQVSKWKKKDIAWVDENLRFKGRIERDGWMSQAKILAKGGETEFSKKKKKT